MRNCNQNYLPYLLQLTFIAQKMQFSIKVFLCKCDQIRRKLCIWSHVLKKSSLENFIFCGVITDTNLILTPQIHVLIRGQHSKVDGGFKNFFKTWKFFQKNLHKTICKLPLRNCKTYKLFALLIVAIVRK